jgi:hypothetical protein
MKSIPVFGFRNYGVSIGPGTVYLELGMFPISVSKPPGLKSGCEFRHPGRCSEFSTGHDIPISSWPVKAEGKPLYANDDRHRVFILRSSTMKKIIGLLGVCFVLTLPGCFNNDQNQDKGKDQSKPSLQMQQPDEKK